MMIYSIIWGILLLISSSLIADDGNISNSYLCSAVKCKHLKAGAVSTLLPFFNYSVTLLELISQPRSVSCP